MEVRLDRQTDGQMTRLLLQQGRGKKTECQEELGELLMRLCWVDLNSEMKVRQVHVDYSGKS